MTHNEKAEMLKDTIDQLYEKEGRSQVYISNLLAIDRKVLNQKIAEWEFVKADERHLKPSNQKFLNKNRKTIRDMLDSDCSISEIATAVGKTRHSVVQTFIKNDKELLHHYNQYKYRLSQKSSARIQELKNSSTFVYDAEDLEDEIWRDVLGFEGYQVSNMGRVRRFAVKYQSYHLVTPSVNQRSGYLYVTLHSGSSKKNISLARLVAHTFVPGHSKECNTVDHKDTDKSNNKASNLEWVTQAENNARAYASGRKVAVGYTKTGKFKEIVVDGQYRFKTIVSMAKFLGVSETQAHRYIDGETKIDRKIEIIY